MCEICAKLTLKMWKRRYERYSGVFIDNFVQIMYIALVFLFLTLNK